MVKFLNKDRYDGFVLRDSSFIHEDGYVSSMIDNFHVDNGVCFPNGVRRMGGVSYGVNKKPWRCSRKAIYIDAYYVGKSGD